MAQGFLLKELPVVKARAVRQAEPGHKVAAIEGHGLVEQGDAQRADLVRRVLVRAALVDEISKVGYVYPQGQAISIRFDQLYLIAVCVEAAGAEHFVEHGQVASQVGIGQGSGSVGPKQGGERLSLVDLPGDGEIGQQGQRFAAADFERLFVLLEARRTE